MEIRDKILSQDYAEFFFPEFDLPQDVYNRYKVEFVQPISNRYATIYVPLAETDDFVLSNYGYGMIPRLYGLMDTSPLDVSGITQLANQPVLSLKGQGVIIGIIDTGIDYTNPAFIDENGNTRILRIWDQSSNEGKLPGVLEQVSNMQKSTLKINYGSEYTDEDINKALASDNPYSIVGERDEIGHGTFLAGVAGGTPNAQNNFSGAATEAKFIVVKLKQAKTYLRRYNLISDEVPAYQENDIVIASSYIKAYGALFNMPVSLLIAMGSNRGGHEGKSILSTELNNYENNVGTVVTVAAGNEGNARHHYRGRVRPGEGPAEFEVRVGGGQQGFVMEIWIDPPQVFSVGLVSPTGEVVNRIPARMGASQIINFVFEKTRLYVEYNIVDAVTGAELIFLRFIDPAEGIWRIRVYDTNVNTGNFNCWLPITQFVGEETYFLEPDPEITITDPGMAEDVITVSAYNSSNGAYYQNSGRGFTRTGRVKPDVAAPGVNITGPTLTGGFENRSSTSAAAAITAGASAQFLTWALVQGNVLWTSSTEVKSYIIRGAIRDGDMEYPNPLWGYGKLNIYNAFNVMRIS